MERKIYGPFRDRNKRGLPIVMKNGFPAWMVVQPEVAFGERKEKERADAA